MLRFSCPVCRALLQVADELAGTTVACGYCGSHMQLPKPAPPAPAPVPPAPVARPQTPASTPARAAPRPAARPKTPASATAAVRPARRTPAARQLPARKSQRSRGRGCAVCAVVLLLAGGAGLAWWQLGQPRPDPERVAAARRDGRPTFPERAREDQRQPDRGRAKGKPTARDGPAPRTYGRDAGHRPAEGSPPRPPVASREPSGPARGPDQPPAVIRAERARGPAIATVKSGPPVELNPDIPLAEDLPFDLAIRVQDRINQYRQAEGVAPVSLDPRWSRGCLAHARYLARNGGVRVNVEVRTDDEDPRLPGFSGDGLYTAHLALIDFREPLAALAGWAQSPATKGALLHPDLQAVGAGWARNARGKWVCVLDLTSGIKTAHRGIVIFPRDRQLEVPVAFPGNEFPDPIPHSKTQAVGNPVTVTFPPTARVAHVTATLDDDLGRAVDLWLSAPEKPANEAYRSHQANTVCLIAKAPLKPATTYRVRVAADVDGRRWSRTWQFTTRPAPTPASEIDAAVERINLYRRLAGVAPLVLDPDLSRACRQHARYAVLNLERLRKQELRADDEDSTAPGYTEEGRKVARRALVDYGGWSVGTSALALADAVEQWLGTYSRRFLHPALRRFGLGYDADGAGRAILVMDTSDGHDPHGPTRLAVLFPADGEQEVPLVYPPRLRSTLGPVVPKEESAGYAVTASFPWGMAVEDVEAALADGQGRPVKCRLSTPSDPLAPDRPQNCICLLPPAPLRPGTTYTASVRARVNGHPWAKRWNFRTTAFLPLSPGQTASKIVPVVNAQRRLAGLEPVAADSKRSAVCLAHARYLVRNEDRPEVQGLKMHDEDPKLPGYTRDGDELGKQAVITKHLHDPVESIDWWMRTLYHRRSLLRPGLERVAFAAVQYPDGTWCSVLYLGEVARPARPAPGRGRGR